MKIIEDNRQVIVYYVKLVVKLWMEQNGHSAHYIEGNDYFRASIHRKLAERLGITPQLLSACIEDNLYGYKEQYDLKYKVDFVELIDEMRYWNKDQGRDCVNKAIDQTIANLGRVLRRK